MCRKILKQIRKNRTKGELTIRLSHTQICSCRKTRYKLGRGIVYHAQAVRGNAGDITH